MQAYDEMDNQKYDLKLQDMFKHRIRMDGLKQQQNKLALDK